MNPERYRGIAFGFPGASSGIRITPFIAAFAFLFLLHCETKKGSSSSATALRLGQKRDGGIRVPLNRSFDRNRERILIFGVQILSVVMSDNEEPRATMKQMELLRNKGVAEN